MARLLVSLHDMSSIGKIGLFDSGLGGLTVLRALNKMLPDAAKVYYGDTLHLPYGDKSDEAIVGYSTEIVQFSIPRTSTDADAKPKCVCNHMATTSARA